MRRGSWKSKTRFSAHHVHLAGGSARQCVSVSAYQQVHVNVCVHARCFNFISNLFTRHPLTFPHTTSECGVAVAVICWRDFAFIAANPIYFLWFFADLFFVLLFATSVLLLLLLLYALTYWAENVYKSYNEKLCVSVRTQLRTRWKVTHTPPHNLHTRTKRWPKHQHE